MQALLRYCWPHTRSPLALGDGPPTARAGHAAGLKAACTRRLLQSWGVEDHQELPVPEGGRAQKCGALARHLLLSLGLLGLLAPVVTHANDSTSSVVLGTLEPDYNFPWVVKVAGNLTCHGILIADQWVLTAAHCLYNRFSGVTVTYTRTTPTGTVTSGSLQTGQNSVFVHPDYKISGVDHDIGLVKLPTPFAPDPFLQAAELPLDAPVLGQQGLVAAQTSTPGKDAVLRGSIVLAGGPAFSVISSTASLCPGDSGSGFVVPAGGRNVVLGVAANTPTSNNCTQAGWEFEAMSVDAYAEWIRSQTGIEDPKRHLVDRSAEFETPPAASPPTACVIPGLGVSNIAYRDTAGQLHELWRDARGTTGTTNLTAIASAPLATGNPFAYVDTRRNTEILLFRGGDGTVRSLYWSTGAVGHDNLSGTARAPKATGDPVGYYAAAYDTHNVIYRTSDGHLHSLYWVGVAPVIYGGNLTGTIAAPPAAGDPTAYIDAAGFNIVVYRSVKGDILSVYWANGPSGLDNLSGVAGTPLAAGDPVAYYTAHNDTHQVVYRGGNGHLYELYWAGVAPVAGWDLTAPAGAPAATGTPAAYYSASTNTKHVVYRSADGGLHEIVWAPGGGIPAHINLTAAYAAPPAAADRPAAFTVQGLYTQHLAYRGSDQHIYEMRW
jgi:Trypsin